MNASDYGSNNLVKNKPVSVRAIEIDGRKVLVRRYAPHNAYAGAHTWTKKGGFITVTGGNGIGIVPAAFRKSV